jgi:hypothetical protein
MDLKIHRCLLTDYPIEGFAMLEEMVYVYTTPLTGKVKIALPAAIEFVNSNTFHRPELAGLCREAHELKLEPPLISINLINHLIKEMKTPKTFPEKALRFLTLLYNMGANDYKPTDLDSDNDYPMAFAEDSKQFIRIIDYLKDKHWVKVGSERVYIGSDSALYCDVLLTDLGIDEVQKGLPSFPMFGLVSQEITTGDSVTDEKINHARKLFFKDGASMEDMRSACVALSSVLEPLRNDLAIVITSADVNAFFELVNKFDIRHNKAATINLVHPEQLEWVFYSLLNTINVYTKLKARLT